MSLHAMGAAALVVVPLLADEPLPTEGDRVASAFFVMPAYAAPPLPPPPPAAARAARPPTQVVRVGGVIRELRKVKDVAPAYPNIARAAKIQAWSSLSASSVPGWRRPPVARAR